jgi:threonyl-tRNA synthetase
MSGLDGWELNPGDGAFYGPKIDITISDALRRQHQCATIQLDFQLPQRFKLEYMTADTANAEPDAPRPDNAPKPGFERPVMIHRAIYGSLERFIGILTEHVAGRWPFWLSPRQVLIIPVAPVLNEYCESVQKELREQGFHADTDLSGNTVSLRLCVPILPGSSLLTAFEQMQKKIRTGQLALYNFIFVLGAQERDSGTVNIRNRDDPATQKMGELVPLKDAVAKLKALADERRFENQMA